MLALIAGCPPAPSKVAVFFIAPLAAAAAVVAATAAPFIAATAAVLAAAPAAATAAAFGAVLVEILIAALVAPVGFVPPRPTSTLKTIWLRQSPLRRSRRLERSTGSQRPPSRSLCRAPGEGGRRRNRRRHGGSQQRWPPPAARGPAAIGCRPAANFRRIRRRPIASKPLVDGPAWRRQHSRPRQRPIGRRRHWRYCQPRRRLKGQPRVGRRFG